jgi:hypothetical protein
MKTKLIQGGHFRVKFWLFIVGQALFSTLKNTLENFK